ncbi:MAG: thiamine-phosphate kinase [bacterium]
MSEESFVRFLRDHTAKQTTSPGDDCAVLTEFSPPLLATVDCMVNEVHFTEEASTRQLANKLIGINLSDIAAMGGRPEWSLLTIANSRSISDIQTFTSDVIDRLQNLDIDLIGGDLSSASDSQEEYLSLTLLGQASETGYLARSSARPGDCVVVSGSLGGVRAELATLDSRQAAAQSDRLYDPPNRVSLGQTAVEAGVRAGMDISDGLIKDLKRFCKASGIGAILDYEDVPVDPRSKELAESPEEALQWALDGGEDFELLLAVPPDSLSSIKEEFDVSVIGQFRDKRGIDWDPPLPESVTRTDFGYDHFD